MINIQWNIIAVLCNIISGTVSIFRNQNIIVSYHLIAVSYVQTPQMQKLVVASSNGISLIFLIRAVAVSITNFTLSIK